MRYIAIILIAWTNINQAVQNIYVCKNARISLYSSAPIEDIKAVTHTGTSVFNAASGELDFSVAIQSFQFEKSLMQEHFNSDYMESDKFPRATFKGKIQEPINLGRDGSYPVTVVGQLTVHGVTQARKINGNLLVRNGELTMKSEFVIKCADHHVDIPQIVFHNIGESIKINVEAAYTLYKSNSTK